MRRLKDQSRGSNPQIEPKRLHEFHQRSAKFNFSQRNFAKLEKSLKALAKMEQDNQAHDFMVKYLKFRQFTKKQVERRERETRFTEADQSSLLFVQDDPAKAKPLNFTAAVYAKTLKNQSKFVENCELKGSQRVGKGFGSEIQLSRFG